MAHRVDAALARAADDEIVVGGDHALVRDRVERHDGDAVGHVERRRAHGRHADVGDAGHDLALGDEPARGAAVDGRRDAVGVLRREQKRHAVAALELVHELLVVPEDVLLARGLVALELLAAPAVARDAERHGVDSVVVRRDVEVHVVVRRRPVAAGARAPLDQDNGGLGVLGEERVRESEARRPRADDDVVRGELAIEVGVNDARWGGRRRHGSSLERWRDLYPGRKVL
mmetsp:Transcript_34453/g.106483  ORF Transcript_34453/g.106483 Transcript_34453/m.106483 type:complete len:230 (+) Transcript_34453:1112-1801(+)